MTVFIQSYRYSDDFQFIDYEFSLHDQSYEEKPLNLLKAKVDTIEFQVTCMCSFVHPIDGLLV